VGDVGLGKTTLASALIQTLPAGAAIIAAERAAELHLLPGVLRRAANAPTPSGPGGFGSQIQAALDESPDWLIVDEIRGDESAAVWDALTREAAPHYLWVFRGDPHPDRLRSALGMAIRREFHAVEQGAIHRALARHLPFVAAIKRVEGAPRLGQIAEWMLGEGDDPPLELRPLLIERGGAWHFTDQRPARPLGLPGDFWT